MTPFDLTLLLAVELRTKCHDRTGRRWQAALSRPPRFFSSNYLVAEVLGANRRFPAPLQEQPALLIHDGKVIEPHMAKEHVGMDDSHRAEQASAAWTRLRCRCSKSISCLQYDEIECRTRVLTWCGEGSFRRSNENGLANPVRGCNRSGQSLDTVRAGGWLRFI